MDNLPRDNNQDTSDSQGSGQIFSNTPESPYQQATELPGQEYQQDQQNLYQPDVAPHEGAPQFSEPPVADISSSQPPSQPPYEESQNIPPPPFAENSKKRVFLFAIIIIGFLLVLILLFRFIISRFTTKPPVVQNITLTYWGLWEEEEIVRPVIDEYQKQHPNIKISYLRQDPKQYRERLQAAIDRGEGPDIFRFHNTWLPMMLQYLSPVPKTIISDADFTKTFYPVTVSDVKQSGNFYGIPLQIDGLVLFYNEDILKSANIEVPQTWVDVQNAVGKLTVKEGNRIITSAIALGTAENIEHFSDILGLMMLQNGVQPVQSLSSCSNQSTTNCGIEALSFYHKFAETPLNTWDNTLENSIVAFAGGKVAMILAPSWQALTIKQISPDLHFKAAAVPQLPCDRDPCPKVTWATYWIEGVSNKSQNQQAAWEYLKYLSSADTLQKLYAEEVKYRKIFGEAYPRIDQAELLTQNQYLAPVISQALTYQSFYTASRTEDGESGLNTSLNNYLKNAVNSLSQGTSAETALKTADKGFKEVFSRFSISAGQ